MSAFASVMMFGNSIGSCDMFLGVILAVWGLVFIITGDHYDMRNDVIGSIKKKRNKSL